MEIISRKVLRYHGNYQPQGPTLSWKLSAARSYAIMEIISRKVLPYHGNYQSQGPTLSWKLSPVRYYNIMEIVSRKVLRDYGNYRRVGWERVAMFGGLFGLLRFLVRVNTLLIRASTLSSTR